MSEFKEAYRDASKYYSGACALESAKFVDEVQKAVDEAVLALKKEAVRLDNVSVNFTKGNLAEVWHSETLKVSAAAKGNSEIKAEVLGTNKTGQDISYGDSSVEYNAELKYYNSAERTAKQLGNPDYNNSQKIVPTDQLEGVIAESQKQAFRNQGNRPEVSSAYQNTADQVSDRLEVNGINSKPLTESEAKNLAADLKQNNEINPEKYGLRTEGFIEWSDIYRESGSAALNAVIFSAAITAAPNVLRILAKYKQSGQLDEILLREGVGNVISHSSNAGLRGGIAAVITGSCKAGLLGPSLKGISPSAVGMATAMILSSIEHSWRYAQGKISGKELAFNSSRDAIALAMGVGGAILGQMVIPIPMLGALIGNLVGATLGATCSSYANNKVLAICVETGWTFWGFVDQNYIVPEEVLKEVGFDLFSHEIFMPEQCDLNRFSTRTFQENHIGFTVLRRGVISFNTIGYQC